MCVPEPLPYHDHVRRLLAPLAIVAVVLAGCGGSDAAPIEDLESFTLRERLLRIDDVTVGWENAATLDAAHRAAEAAANLVVGPGGPDFGDRDADGSVGGDSDFGVLMGLDGEPVGLADPLASNECVDADVLGGSWDDPGARWAELDSVIAAWSEDDNTMPQLASHPMRIVGWATLALGTDDLDAAIEYAGHARLHVDVSLDALDC